MSRLLPPTRLLNQTQAFHLLYRLNRHELLDIRQQFRDAAQLGINRADELSIRWRDWCWDYAKTSMNLELRRLLLQLAEETHLAAWLAAQQSGALLNHTEQRAVLHTALRAATPPNLPHLSMNPHDVIPQQWSRMRLFCEQIQAGCHRGATGEPITTIVNIGIGGSHLGPELVYQAMCAEQTPLIPAYFVSNVDGQDLAHILTSINPATTIFIIASKTFTTAETMQNARSAQHWLKTWLMSQIHLNAHLHPVDDDTVHELMQRHFVAVTNNTQAAQAFGINSKHVFPMWDWVGGRVSLWSTVGLVIPLAFGFTTFTQLLAGAEAMDQHFMTAPWHDNLPVMQALLGIWHRNFCGYAQLNIAPYHQGLGCFPAWLQQLDMESNGKQVSREGLRIPYATSPVVFGMTGTQGQHAFFQQVHQGGEIIPTDFILTARPSRHALQHLESADQHHDLILRNGLAQAEALLVGQTEAQARAKLAQYPMRYSPALMDDIAPHQTFSGNRPSTLLLLPQLDAFNLGALLAMYEHKTLVQGMMWGVYSFDQWGVELGKEIAQSLPMITGVTDSDAADVFATLSDSTQSAWHYLQQFHQK
jgi:glucose-6-phosphate isomerase